jgi:hypothetical protein
MAVARSRIGEIADAIFDDIIEEKERGFNIFL